MDKHTGHDFSGLVRQATVGIELEVPVPRNIISATVAIALGVKVKDRYYLVRLCLKYFLFWISFWSNQ